MNKDIKTKENLGSGLKLWNYISFSMAGMASYLLFNAVSSFQSVFYTDVLGITAGAISIIMLVSKIWDAANDPMMGIIAERTKSKWGRFRPWLLWMAPVLAITFILTFVDWPGSPTIKAVLAGISYILFGMAYTAAGIPMQSLPTVMTRNVSARVKLYSGFGIGSQVGGIIVSALFMNMVLILGNGEANSSEGYLWTVIIFGIVAGVLTLVSFTGTQEHVHSIKKGESLPMKESLKILFKDRNALLLLGGMVFALTGVFGRVAIVAYYYMYVLERIDLVSIGITLNTIGMLVPYFFLPILLKKFQTKKLMAFSCVLCALSCIMLYFGLNSTVLVLIGTFLLGACNWLTLGSQTLVSQIIDDNELKKGVRTEGILVAMISFSTKLASAIGSALGVPLIVAAGYIPNVVQSASTKSGMNLVINIGPMICYLAAIGFFIMIKKKKKKAAENTAKLAELQKQTDME